MPLYRRALFDFIQNWVLYSDAGVTAAQSRVSADATRYGRRVTQSRCMYTIGRTMRLGTRARARVDHFLLSGGA